MAYNLSERFPRNSNTIPLLEPAGVYQRPNSISVRSNKVPFLSKSSRNTGTASKLRTHAMYFGDVLRRIPNCTSISSKIPRFPYELLSKEDIEEIICKCGIGTTCDCCSEEREKPEDETICQGKVLRRIFKGITSKSIKGNGTYSSYEQDQNYKILPNGSRIRALKQDNLPFYDTDVIEHSAFYRGWKWSKWTSQRIRNLRESTPGPGTYTITTKPVNETICLEKLRALKRKTSKQVRFGEMIQRKNVLDNFPGPAKYQPTSPKGTNLNFLGPKAKRFISSKYNEIPGPTKYNIKRDFESDEEPLKYCHAKVRIAAPFGSKAVRFKYSTRGGPSPASYDSNYKACKFPNCTLAPFNSSTKRFKSEIEISDTVSDSEIDDNVAQESQSKNRQKNLPSWEFRSKTIRMKPLVKKFHEPSPADLPPPMNKKERRRQFQHASPFFSSEPRFQPWFNWISIHGAENTPGPGYYNLEKPKCLPAVHHGPISRSLRFCSNALQTPAPNTYKIQNGIQTILTTHNEILKGRIKNNHTFHWNPPAKTRLLGLKEKESMLLNKCICLLNGPDIFDNNEVDHNHASKHLTETRTKSKFLHCFIKYMETE